MRTGHSIAAVLAALALVMTAGRGNAFAQTQGATVSFRVSVNGPKGPMKMAAGSADTVVAWLTPTSPAAVAERPPAPAHAYVLAQKNKQFSPHLLVIPTGSNVDFPNLDPFFHNVFSLFNGRHFDLGLYEAGSRRSVRFDHDGVSYIFCNIHPEMGAVIVSLSTPYYATSQPNGSVTLPDVPPGEYDLNVWSQNVSAVDSTAARQHIRVTGANVTLPLIVLKRTESPMVQHLNKFGEEYKKPGQAGYQGPME